MEYRKWLRTLETILLQRFGLSVDDAFAENQLKNFFNCGDAPVDVAGELKRKRGLVDIRNHELPTNV